MQIRRYFMLLLAGALATVCLTACSSSASSSSTPSSSPSQYYVSLGDSYASGYQPTGQHSGHTDTNGFAYQIPKLAAARGYSFKLVNFGCSGATTTSILKMVGCPAAALGPGASAYPGQTQAAAAEQFLRLHRGHVGLVTVSIGGNDVDQCTSRATPIPCVAKGTATIKANLPVLLTGLRSAAGPDVRIIGLTYPDVVLAESLSSTAALKQLSTLSIVAFRSLINPTLAGAYKAVGGTTFVDVTAATGAYIPFSQTTTLPPYGTIPVAVANVCKLTFMCEYQNIHPKTAGYTKIAELVVATLPNR